MSSAKASPAWPRVAVVGAGAVGCYFGGMLARAGAPVTLIGRPRASNPAIEAIRRDGLFIDGIHFRETVAVAAVSDPAEARDAELVLFSVKTIDTATAAAGLAPYLRPGAVVVSLQNGVENEQQIRAALSSRAPAPPILPAVVYVAAAMTGPGRLKHVGRGDLVIGRTREPLPDGCLERVAGVFEAAGVPCRISENLEGDLWFKLVWNCAGNAVSALGRASYGICSSQEPACEVMAEAAREVTAVARAAGIRLPDVDPMALGLKVARSFGGATSSTAQDVERGRCTEIDALNGFIVRRGVELGVPTPVNHTLWGLVKLLEESNAQKQNEAAAAPPAQ